MASFETLSPIDNRSVYSGTFSDEAAINLALEQAVQAQTLWADTDLAQRIKILSELPDYFLEHTQAVGAEITKQMGRPIKYSSGEVNGLIERCTKMLELAPEALAPVTPGPIVGFERYIERVPVGVVAVLAPWNYPYLTSINAIIPALAAGNSVILKHSTQTPMVADRYAAAFKAIGLPEGVFQTLFLSHSDTAVMVGDPRIDYVTFTGSVEGGHAIQKAISGRFIGAGLELGGKDPAYVRADADIRSAAITLADGAFFNSGQSCCGVERIYVDETVFDEFVGIVVAEARALKLGDPMDPETTLGPMSSSRAADGVREQINAALESGAIARLPADNNTGSAYLAPQVLTNVSHNMEAMTEETFGPVVGIMAVTSDEQAISLMNDSQYGLTASIWTKDVAAAKAIGRKLETGTVFMNRCDYLDPELAWTGVKNSGRGCTLSTLGYEHLTRPKSFHLKTKTT